MNDVTFTEPIDFQEAIDKLAAKKILPTDLSSRELQAHVSAQLRDRAFFSAKVLNAQILQEFKNGVDAIVRGTSDVAKQRLLLKDLLYSIEYEPDQDKEGTIQDLGSNSRLNLVLNTNVSMLRGFGQWLQGNEEGALDAFPAQELVRVAARAVPREWNEIWDGAVDELGDETTATDSSSGRLVAMKNDPIWLEISDFGMPNPPFKFNSGMGVEDVSYEEAVDLGVMDAQDDPIAPPKLGMNDDLQASVEGLEQGLAGVLAEDLSGLVQLVDGVLRFKNDEVLMRRHGRASLFLLEEALN